MNKFLYEYEVNSVLSYSPKMNKYQSKPDGFEHYVHDELRAVVPWGSRDTYAADWPDAPEDAAAEAAASAPPACVNDMVAEVMVNTGVASVRFVALSAEEREAVRADTMDVVTLVSIASETLAPGTTVMTKTTTPASDNDRPA